MELWIRWGQASLSRGKSLATVRADCPADRGLDPKGRTEAWGPIARRAGSGAKFGVSRTAVREAVKALREKGLVEAYSGRGTFVTDGTSQAIRQSLDLMMKIGQPEGSTHLAEVRQILEPEIAALAAIARGTASRHHARSSCSDGSSLHDPDAYIEADLDFHLALAEAAANPLILSLLDSIVGLLREQRMPDFQGRGRPGARTVPSQANPGSGRTARSGKGTGSHAGSSASRCVRIRLLGSSASHRSPKSRLLSGAGRMMANLGFVGLGVMGGQMVSRLLEKGHTVTGYNRTRPKAQWLIDKGMRWADSPRAVAAAADVTFAMVTNSAALSAITEGPDGLLAGIHCGQDLR